MTWADTPPPAAPTEIVVSRRDGSEIVASRDIPLVLSKAGQREQALVRQALFITASVAVVRPAGAEDSAADRYRWTYRGFLQRQVCFTSITGMFACTASEVETLPDAEEGEAPVAGLEDFPLATAAQGLITAGLKARATALFDADRRTHTDPVFRAAGVAAARAAPPR